MAGPVNHNDIGELLAGVREAVKSGNLAGNAPLVLPAEARIDLPVLRLDRNADAPDHGASYVPEPEIPPSVDTQLEQETSHLETAAERLEDAVLRQGADDWEQDGGDRGVAVPHSSQSRVALPRLDVLRAQVRARRDLHAVDSAPQGAGDEQNDAQLRELVSGLVRAELRGAVGVDISERLRAMVRDEIRTALDARGFADASEERR